MLNSCDTVEHLCYTLKTEYPSHYIARAAQNIRAEFDQELEEISKEKSLLTQ
jgi:hypothetical protein